MYERNQMARPKEFIEISGFPKYKINRNGVIKYKNETITPDSWNGTNNEAEIEEKRKFFVILEEGKKRQSFLISDLVNKTFGEYIDG